VTGSRIGFSNDEHALDHFPRVDGLTTLTSFGQTESLRRSRPSVAVEAKADIVTGSLGCHRYRAEIQFLRCDHRRIILLSQDIWLDLSIWILGIQRRC
jgi:hypothetical protein